MCKMQQAKTVVRLSDIAIILNYEERDLLPKKPLQYHLALFKASVRQSAGSCNFYRYLVKLHSVQFIKYSKTESMFSKDLW